MIFYPAIDLLDGKVVRLFKGLRDRATVYFENPLDAAQRWQNEGARWLHVVDLNAAFSGLREQSGIIKKIVEKSGLKVQVGGGIRDSASVEFYLGEIGVERVVVGTAAYKNWDWFKETAEKFRGRVTLGLDIHEGRVAVKGWTETAWTEEEAFEKAAQTSAAAILLTDVSRDGTLTGPNVPLLKRASSKLPGRVIASGGISNLEDLKVLKGLPLDGVISGKAIYEGKLSVKEAIQTLEGR